MCKYFDMYPPKLNPRWRLPLAWCPQTGAGSSALPILLYIETFKRINCVDPSKTTLEILPAMPTAGKPAGRYNPPMGAPLERLTNIESFKRINFVDPESTPF